MRQLVLTFLCLAVVLVAHAELSAKEKPRARVTFLVADPSGAVISGAFINLRSAETTCERVSGHDGRTTTKLPPGKYELRVTKSGFASYKEQIEISSEPGTIQATLKAGSGGGIEVTQEAEVPGLQRVHVIVTDSHGKPVPDAVVVAWMTIRTSDSAGRISLDIPIGDTLFWVAKDGFKTLKRRVRVGADLAELPITLSVGDDDCAASQDR